MKTGKILKKQLAVAVTSALLALPLGTTLTLADTTSPVETTAAITNTDTTSSVNQNADNGDETTTVVDSEGHEIDPANWLTNLILKLKIALSFDPATKGELSEQLALAKLAQAQKLMNEGKTEESEIAFTEYTDKLTKAQEFLEKIEEDSVEAQKLTVALTNVNQNNIKVLSNLLDKLPPQAAQKLALNVVRSMEKAVTKMENQEAKPSVPTDSDTTTPSAEHKALQKQTKEALKDFKKSLTQKGKIQLEDDMDQEDQHQDLEVGAKGNAAAAQQPSLNNNQPTSVTVVPAKTQAPSNSVRSSNQEKEGRNKQEEKSKDKDGDKKRDN